ncbi:hypothetical protein KBX26_15280 [Micromonospora sp. C97]|uniref:hypothetical protein n=1 Tax=Micromonospora sp. C97 TaxID=2824883 RepID=UPI001B38B5FF|nr:hypothetical protein [Micromonospora sp. C97]MBQ1031355.1 hypothetical protein [Micromonospora sp. C97]
MVAVVDAEGGVGVFDSERLTGMTDADVDALAGDDEDAAAADAAFDAEWLGCRGGWRSGGAGVANTCLLGWSERVGQADLHRSIGMGARL